MENKTGKQRAFFALPNYDARTHVACKNTVAQCGAEAKGSSTVPVRVMDSSVSALCFNYNTLWCKFHELWTKGECDLFVMVHSDLEVVGHPYWSEGRSWLDWMWDTMLDRGFSCLSVVNAIKSREGKTSTAMGQGPKRARPVTLKELEPLDKTFGANEFYDACGHTLLVNTGIMVIKPEPRWAHDFAFEFHDEVHTMPDGSRQAVFHPEDWNMSRFFHAHCVPYGATLEVKTLHHGSIGFPNWDDGTGFYQYGDNP